MEIVRFADSNATGDAEQVLYTVPAGSTLRQMFEGGGTVRARLSSAYVNLLRGVTSRALPLFNLALTFGYNGPDVRYYDADASGTLNETKALNEWNLYFNQGESNWFYLPNGSIGSLSCLWVPPQDYTFAAGDDLFFFATLEIDQVKESDPFKNFLKP
jgi:hypothetical protein